MFRYLATPDEVVATAFAQNELTEPSAVSPADILLTEERYIVPVTGRQLYEKMLDGGYRTLRDDYVVPAVAYFTRLKMQPLFDINTGRFGSTVPHSDTYAAASREMVLDARRALRDKARSLLRALSDHLNAHAADYPQYRPEKNVLNRCTTDGGIVQVR